MKEQKELIISIPEGYEIDKENSTFEKIIFKPIPIAKTWKKYMEQTCSKKADTAISRMEDSTITCVMPFKMNDPNQGIDFAVKHLSFMKLMALVRDINPKGYQRFVIKYNMCTNNIEIFNSCYGKSNPLCFEKYKDAEEFLLNNSDLLQKAIGLF